MSGQSGSNGSDGSDESDVSDSSHARARRGPTPELVLGVGAVLCADRGEAGSRVVETGGRHRRHTSVATIEADVKVDPNRVEGERIHRTQTIALKRQFQSLLQIPFVTVFGEYFDCLCAQDSRFEPLLHLRRLFDPVVDAVMHVIQHIVLCDQKYLGREIDGCRWRRTRRVLHFGLQRLGVGHTKDVHVIAMLCVRTGSRVHFGHCGNTSGHTMATLKRSDIYSNDFAMPSDLRPLNLSLIGCSLINGTASADRL